MRLLFLTQVLPYPLDAGPKIRAYYTLRHLGASHDVTLLSFVRDSDSASAVEHMKSICRQVLAVPITRSRLADARYWFSNLLTPTPFLIARDWSRLMCSVVDRAVAELGPFDVVHADQLWMAPYALRARSAAGAVHSPRLVLDQHNAVFQIPLRMARGCLNPLKRLALNVESAKLAHYECNTCQKFDHTVFVSLEDQRALQKRGLELCGGDRQSVIPIAVDSSSSSSRGDRRHRVTFLGGMHWPPNAEGISWFASKAWPLIAERAPEAVLTIIGKEPPAGLKTRTAGHVEITGYVDDADPYLEETSVFIVPLLSGGGMRVKILDAWTRGIPIVSTAIGAEGVSSRDGENLILADNPRAMAEAVVRILTDAQLAGRLSMGGRRTVEEHYDWRRTYSAWDKVYACESSSSLRTSPA